MSTAHGGNQRRTRLLEIDHRDPGSAPSSQHEQMLGVKRTMHHAHRASGVPVPRPCAAAGASAPAAAPCRRTAVHDDIERTIAGEPCVIRMPRGLPSADGTAEEQRPRRRHVVCLDVAQHAESAGEAGSPSMG